MQPSLALPDELTIYAISDLYPLCSAWAQSEPADASNDALEVLAETVVEVDASGVQLLLSLHNTLQVGGRRLVLVRPSAVLLEACAALGAQCLIDAANAINAINATNATNATNAQEAATC